MKTIEINNTIIHYKETGEGIPVIFVHGSMSDFRTWKSQITLFAKKFHAIAYSRVYHFPNAFNEPVCDYTISRHSNDLIQFIKALHLSGPVNLVGSSYGAFTCLDAAMKDPQIIKTLILGEPPVLSLLFTSTDNPFHIFLSFFRYFLTNLSFWKFRIKTLKKTQEQFLSGNLEEAVRIFTNGVIEDRAFERLPAPAKASIMENANALKAEFQGPGFPEFSKQQAKQLQIPTLLVYGKNSPRFFHSISNKLFNLLPNCERVFIPNAAHSTHGDNPKVYNQKVLEFLLKHN
ncbi:MAG: alpha/beta hydrolase [Bacteroidetes bacterium]|nr:alpha/beta hydrolase [Bacteroidota bacterium]HET6245162.1 alpha/beta hydrolase [Bacteroidia bacterium]